MLRALVFDFDGLILDTETPVIEAFAEVHEHHQVPFNPQDALSLVGHVDKPFEPWRAFPVTHSRDSLEEEYRVAKWRRLLAQPLQPGVQNLIQGAKEHGLKLGLASNSHHAWINRHLPRLGLADAFDAIRCRDDVMLGKPDPEVYLAVTQALGVDPREALSFEDSPPGSQAARAAGLYSVVAPNPSTRHHKFPHAHRVVNTLADVSINEWLQLKRWSA